MPTDCPICRNAHAETGNDGARAKQFDCPVCGKYELVGKASMLIKNVVEPDSRGAATLSHVVRKMQKQNEWASLTQADIERIMRDSTLPLAVEQADNLILWL